MVLQKFRLEISTMYILDRTDLTLHFLLSFVRVMFILTEIKPQGPTLLSSYEKKKTCSSVPGKRVAVRGCLSVEVLWWKDARFYQKTRRVHTFIQVYTCSVCLLLPVCVCVRAPIGY